jgi:uncharacterized membrane protein
MNSNQDNPEKWVDSTTDLIESYRQLITIRIVQHSSLGISMGVIGMASMILGVFVFLFVGLGAAWWLGEYLNNMKAGFFIIGGLFTFIFAIVIAASHKVLIPRIRNFIIKKIYEQD